jgi:hypothetical protein
MGQSNEEAQRDFERERYFRVSFDIPAFAGPPRWLCALISGFGIFGGQVLNFYWPDEDLAILLIGAAVLVRYVKLDVWQAMRPRCLSKGDQIMRWLRNSLQAVTDLFVGDGSLALEPTEWVVVSALLLRGTSI